MWIIERLIAQPTAEELHGKQRHSLALACEERRWSRGHFTTSAGHQIALALPTGTRLMPGTVVLVETGWYVTIAAADEPVLEVYAPERATAMRIAFEVGNRHFPLALSEQGLLVPDDPAMVNLMERLGARFERRCIAFEPLGLGAHSHDS